MAGCLTNALAALSDAIAAQVAAAAPLLAAIRVGPNRHVSGIVWQRDLVITSDQALPALDSFTLVLSGGVLTAARPARRNAASNLASLRLEASAIRLRSCHRRNRASVPCAGVGPRRRRGRSADWSAWRSSIK